MCEETIYFRYFVWFLMATMGCFYGWILIFEMGSVKKLHADANELIESAIKFKFDHTGDYDKNMYVKLAEIEFKKEEFRDSVESYKLKLRNKKKWHYFVPFKIVRR